MIDFQVLEKGDSKLSQIHIGKITDRFYRNFLISKHQCRYVFDFSHFDWVSNEALLVLSGLMNYLYEGDYDFYAKFLINQSTKGIDRRKASQYVQMWKIWEIRQVVPLDSMDVFFDIDNKIIRELQQRYNIQSESEQVYERHGITPFKILNKVSNYDDKKVSEMLDEVYTLSDATFEILRNENCHIPFENRTLSYIITKELYENFLDHFESAHLDAENDHAYLSVLLSRKLNTDAPQARIQKTGKGNLKEEIYPELHGFYTDERGQYKNQSVLEFSFIDFGNGIPKTLKATFEKSSTQLKETAETGDGKILEYAFRYDSSRHPIDQRYSGNILIPRGLFDLISIVKRFKGLLFVRSNNGRIAYDFSKELSIEDSKIKFPDSEDYFPGTLISISIPEQNLKIPFNSTVIKPYPELSNYSFDKLNSRHISVFDILRKIKTQHKDKIDLYDNVLQIVTDEIGLEPKGSLIYLDFKFFEIDERVARKLLYFISTDYRVNIENNIIVVNPPSQEYLKTIQNELVELNEIVKDYIIHPTPFVYIKSNGSETDLNVYWLGIFNELDLEKLNQLLFEIHDLRKTDFVKPDAIVGNVNYYDQQNNLKSYLTKSEFVQFYKETVLEADELALNELITKCKKHLPQSVFLCDGNYYQNEYLQLFDVLSAEDDCEFLAKGVHERLMGFHGDLSSYKILAVKSNGQKITESLLKQKAILKTQVIRIDTPSDIRKKKKLQESDKVILLCDVISTGYMTNVIERTINELGATLIGIGVLVNAIDEGFETEKFQYDKLESKITSLLKIPIKKFWRDSIKTELKNKELSVVRINPFTNTPISALLSSSNFDESVLIDNKTFIDIINAEHIKAGFYEFNNLIHPYFFDMDAILSNKEVSFKLLESIFAKIDSKTKQELEIAFYPRNCGISQLNFDLIKNEVLKNQRIEFHRLERYPTYEGWRFPHPPEFLKKLSQGKNALILDDGSCTGESLIQMIDEVAFLGVKKLTVLSIIGRVNNHKREFFSRLKNIEIDNGIVELRVYFGSHWNVPTYHLQDSPIIAERLWLNRLLKIRNVPSTLNAIAGQVSDEISSKDALEDHSNKHLLKKHDGASVIKDLVLMREHVGRVTSYRFYTDYFKEFDELIAYYASKKDYGEKARYDSIGRLCGVFLHEPYLFDQFRMVMPDVVDKLQEFSLTILLGNPKKSNLPKISKDGLYHSWKNKDILHLFFTVCDENEVITYLNTGNLERIIRYHGKNPKDLNYLLYRLLKFFPLNLEDSQNKIHAEQLLNVIMAVTKSYEESTQKSHLKLFLSFLLTLPIDFKPGFKQELHEVSSNYQKLTDEKYHNGYIHSNKQVLGSQMKLVIKQLLANKPVNDPMLKVKEAWAPIATFIEDILKFSNSNRNFFVREKDYDALHEGQKSLAHQFGMVQEIIQLGKEERMNGLMDIVNGIFGNFIDEDSNISKIFQTTTCNIDREFNRLINDIKSEFEPIAIEGNDPPRVSVDFPLHYVRRIVFDEIGQNLRHADTLSPVTFIWTDQVESVVLEVKNKKSTNPKYGGGGKGIERLKRLNSYPLPMNYTFQENEDFVTQQFTFKKL